MSFIVTITATDSTLSVSQNSTIIIRGENEFPPEFNTISYSTEIRENDAPSTSPLITVSATDQDEVPDQNANASFVSRITYSFLNPTPFFSINAITGEVFQEAIVDREQNARFVLDVIANDNDATPTARTQQVPLFIEVRNINDEPPQFIALDDIIVVSEEFPVRVGSFYTVQFSDPDPDSSLQLVLAPPSAEFLLNSANGELQVNSDLDADIEPRVYFYNLTLTDINTDPVYANTSMTISRAITIIVRDNNDNVPQFIMPIFGSNYC